MKWIDAHTHIGNDVGDIDGRYDDIAAWLDDGTLDKAVVFCMNEVEGIQQGNKNIRKTVQDDDRLAGLFRVDPAIHDPADLREADAFAGFKMHPRAQDFGMQRVYEHMEAIGETGKPVLIHTGIGDDPGLGRAHPEEIMDAAEIHSETDIIFAHNTKGYYFHAPDTFIESFQTLDNVYIETSLHCTPLSIETLTDDLGKDKVLFGSDYPYGHPVPMQKNIECADVSEDVAGAVAWKNAERLFF